MSVGPDQVRAAGDQIRGLVRRTPVLDFVIPGGTSVALKLEMMQHTGSFKPRGAFNKALNTQHAKALVAASGGNHGLAVAYVAEQLGYAADIVVPKVISPAKLDALRATAARVSIVGEVYADALVASYDVAQATGAVMVHAYDDPDVIAGQGTTFMELHEQLPDIDAVVVAVGGGGLAGGAAAWFGPKVAIHTVETDRTPTLHTALKVGAPTPVEVGGIAADSLGARQIGGLAFELLASRVASSLVSDAQVAAAQRLLWTECRVVSEPGGATALAGVLSGVVDVSHYRRPVVLVCGGNTDLSAFPT